MEIKKNQRTLEGSFSEWSGVLGVCGVESELSSKTEGIGVPPALEKEPGKGKNRIGQILLMENSEKNQRKERRVSNEKARTTEQTNPANGRQKLQSDQASRMQSLKD